MKHSQYVIAGILVLALWSCFGQGLVVSPAGTSTTVTRSMVGSGHLSASDGDGVSSNPTMTMNDVPSFSAGWFTNMVLYVDQKGVVTGAVNMVTVAGNAYLAANQAWTGSNYFSGPLTYGFTDLVAATNSTANTNIIVDMTVKTTRLALTNNATFTNWIGNSPNTSGGFTVIIQPQLINRTVVWPAISASIYGLYFRTNSGSTLWTTLTNGVEYWLTGDRHDTNVVLTISAFQ